LLTIDAGEGQALAYLQAAIALYERLDEPLELACARLHTARRLAVRGRCEDANEQLAQARPILEHCGLAKAIGVYLNASGCVMGMRGDLAAARLDYERAVALNRGAGAVINEIVALNSLADIRWAQGDLEGASATFSELAARIRQSPTGRTHSLGIACCNLAGILVERGEIDRALSQSQATAAPRDAGSASRFIDRCARR
jgi:tetratricopeptide (TPR) repeat protein